MKTKQTHVDYWQVNATKPTQLPFGHADISAHVTVDWQPGLPPSASAAFAGWPPYLTEECQTAGVSNLALKAEAGRSDRQWKGFLSWMIGVAGARAVMAAEGYKWIAPLSAFYPNAVLPVDPGLWNSAFPATSLQIASVKTAGSRLRPDYIALSGSPGSYRWAIVESKGTRHNLSQLSCPDAWKKQVANAQVSLNGITIPVQRRIVVATRVNPNAAQLKTRRIQVRAWNSDDPSQAVPGEVGIEVVSAHLFGLCVSLGLRRNADAIARASRRRREASSHVGSLSNDDTTLLNAAEQEIQRDNDRGVTRVSRIVADDRFSVELDNSLVSLIEAVRRGGSVDELELAIDTAEKGLASWPERGRMGAVDERWILMPNGLRFHAEVRQ